MTTPVPGLYPPPGGRELGAPPPLRGRVAVSTAGPEDGSSVRAGGAVAGAAGTGTGAPWGAPAGGEPVVPVGSAHGPDAAIAVAALLGAALGLALQRRWGR